jgi:hypothetical protein
MAPTIEAALERQKQMSWTWKVLTAANPLTKSLKVSLVPLVKTGTKSRDQTLESV